MISFSKYFYLLIILTSANIFRAQEIFSYDSIFLSSFEKVLTDGDIEYNEKLHVNIIGLKNFKVVEGNYWFSGVISILDSKGDVLLSEELTDKNVDLSDVENPIIPYLPYQPVKAGEDYYIAFEILDKYSNQKVSGKQKFHVNPVSIGKNMKTGKTEGFDFFYIKAYKDQFPFNGDVFFPNEELAFELLFNPNAFGTSSVYHTMNVYKGKENIISQADTLEFEEGRSYLPMTYDLSNSSFTSDEKYKITASFVSLNSNVKTSFEYNFEIASLRSFKDKTKGIKFSELDIEGNGAAVSSTGLIEGEHVKFTFIGLEELTAQNGFVFSPATVRLLDNKGNQLWSPNEWIDIETPVIQDQSLNLWIEFDIPGIIPKTDDYIFQILVYDKFSEGFLNHSIPIKINNYKGNEYCKSPNNVGFDALLIKVIKDEKIYNNNVFNAGDYFEVMVDYLVTQDIAESSVFIYDIELRNGNDEELLHKDFDANAPDMLDPHGTQTSKITIDSEWPAGNYKAITKYYSASKSHYLEFIYDFVIE